MPLAERNKEHDKMNVFFEFYKIVQHLQKEGVEYALIGGVAMAFHTEPRFTKDIDILVKKNQRLDLDEEKKEFPTRRSRHRKT